MNQVMTTGTRLRNVASAIGALFRPRMETTTAAVPIHDRSWFTIFDSRAGAWQQDAAPLNTEKVLANWAAYACLTLIAQDAGKLRLNLVEQDENGIWSPARSAAFSPVLHTPNSYQTRQQFIEAWVLSKLGPAGNTYVLKVRDARGIVTAMHVLNPYLVTPLIAPDGSVFYRLGEDWLTKVRHDQDVVPASEIMHDRAPCLFHPLIGVGPIYACGLAAMQGVSIQRNSEAFFRNMSAPSGMLLAPGAISDETAERLKRHWESNYSGANSGKVAVLGDSLKFESMSYNARDSQLTEQLTFSASMICSTYHVPPFKIGLGTIPAGQKVAELNQIYYSDCLQTLLESIEALLDKGLGLDLTGRKLGTEFDLDDLLRMDNASLTSALSDAVGGGIMSPNEARMKMNLPPVSGGDSPYLQQQNYNLGALAKRDARPDPFSAGNTPAPAPAPSPEDLEVEARMKRRLDLAAAEERARKEHETDARVRAEVDRAVRARDESTVRMAAEREVAALLGRVRSGLGA